MGEATLFPDEMQRWALLSEDGVYRYRLGRSWGHGPPLLFVMLNPSTADANIDDPTIRRCIGIAKREMCVGVEVVNLFALRATDPAALSLHPNPVGRGNLGEIHSAVRDARAVVVAWGAHPMARSVIPVFDRPVYCLGTTKDGSPRHPLYVRADQPLIPWEVPDVQ